MPVSAAIQAGQFVCEEPLPSGPGTVLDPKPTVVRATTAITTTITITTATASQIHARRRYRLPSGLCAYRIRCLSGVNPALGAVRLGERDPLMESNLLWVCRRTTDSSHSSNGRLNRCAGGHNHAEVGGIRTVSCRYESGMGQPRAGPKNGTAHHTESRPPAQNVAWSLRASSGRSARRWLRCPYREQAPIPLCQANQTEGVHLTQTAVAPSDPIDLGSPSFGRAERPCPRMLIARVPYRRVPTCLSQAPRRYFALRPSGGGGSSGGKAGSPYRRPADSAWAKGRRTGAGLDILLLWSRCQQGDGRRRFSPRFARFRSAARQHACPTAFRANARPSRQAHGQHAVARGCETTVSDSRGTSCR